MEILLKYIELIDYNNKSLRLLFLVLLIISCIIYKDFIFANKVYILKDIGADLLVGYLPQIIQFKQFFDDFSFYNFTLGLGDSTFSLAFNFIDIFNYFYLFIPNEYIPQTIIYVTILKHILSGLFFYLFLNKFGFDRNISFLVSILFAFSAYIFVWGQHYAFGTNIVYVAFLLFSFERYIKDNKLYLFLFALFLNLLNIYFFFQASIFLIFYVLFRFYYLGLELKRIFYIIGWFVIILLLASLFLIPTISIILDSPRVGGNYFSLEYFTFFENIEYYFSLFFRLFSTDIFGSGNNNLLTTYNYYQAPIVYSGLLLLTILPFAFFALNQKLKKIYIISFIMILLSLFCTFFIAFYNGFSILCHRYFFILNIIFLLLTAKGLNYILLNNIKRWIFYVHFLFLLVVTFYLYTISPLKPDEKFLYIGFGFIFIYMILLHFKKSNIILFFLIIEILILSHLSLKDRIFLEKYEIEKEREDTKKALLFIKDLDKNDFYRIEKTYSEFGLNFSFNDGMYHQYNSTKQYSAMLNKNFLELHSFFGLQTDTMKRKTNSIINNKNLVEFLGVKYLLSKDELFIPNYEKIHYNGNVFIYKNINKDINLGVVYDNFVDFDFISKYDKELRDEIIMQRAIVSNENEKAFSDILKKNLDINFENIYYQIFLLKNVEILEQKENSITYKALNNDPQIILALKKEIEKSSKNYISFELDSPSASQGVIYFGRNNFLSDKKVVFQVDKGKKDYKVYINNDDFNSLRIDIGNQLEIINIKNISINSMKNIPLLTSKNLELKNFKQDNISFDYNGENSSIIVFNILYDIGWKIYVDDKERKSYKLNGAFIGIPIEKGNHNIQLVFLPKFFNLGIYLFILGIVICIIIIYIKLDIINTKNLKNTSKA